MGSRKIVTAALALSVGLGALPATARVSTSERAYGASGYVASRQAPSGKVKVFSPLGSTADAVVAWVAAGFAPSRASRRALGYLRDHIDEATTVGLKAKVALAVVASGKDPRAFAGRDLIAEIVAAQQPDGHYGEENFQEVFDHVLAMLALSASVDAPLDPANDTQGAIDWLVAAQCPDGGWQYDEPYDPAVDDEHCTAADPNDYDHSNVDSTAYAIQALAVHGSLGDTTADPVAFLTSTRDPIKGGWGYDTTFPLTNANSTALALQALEAAGADEPSGAMRALKRLQYRVCGDKRGAFAFTYEANDDGYARGAPDVFATIGAILGLLREPLPVTGPSPDVGDPCA